MLRAAWTPIAALALFAAPAAAQIRVANAGLPSAEAPQLTETLSVRSFENLFQVALDTRVAFVVTPSTALDLRVPLLWNDAEIGGLADEAFGPGDARLRVQHSLFQADDVMWSTRYAVYGELRLPTGDDDALESGGVELPRKLQLGLGSLGVGGGAIASFIRDRHRLSFSAGFRWSDEAGGFQLGTEFEAAAAWWYRIQPAVFTDEPVTEVRGVLELIGTWRVDSELDGADLGDEGFEAWLAPGVQLFPRDDLLIQASLAIPIADGIDDPLGDREVGLAIGVRWYL